ncbi:hypothetical protein D3C73_1401770 [compost metagenome]
MKAAFNNGFSPVLRNSLISFAGALATSENIIVDAPLSVPKISSSSTPASINAFLIKVFLTALISIPCSKHLRRMLFTFSTDNSAVSAI